MATTYEKISSGNAVGYAKSVVMTAAGPVFITEDNSVNYDTILTNWDAKMANRFKHGGDGTSAWETH